MANRTQLESWTVGGNSPVSKSYNEQFCTRVPRDTWNLVGSREDHLPRLNTTWWPIVEQYREGKVKRTPGGEWNRTWNHVPTTDQSTLCVWWCAFCRTSQRVTVCSKVKYLRYGAEGKPSLNRAKVSAGRPETGWSIHVQVEAKVKFRGGPNTHPLKRVVMRCG